MNESRIIEQFPITERCVWLNHAAVSPWPMTVTRALEDFVAENAANGPANYGRWLSTESRLRQRLSRLIDVTDPDDIALLDNTSTAINLVAAGIDWRRGDRVVLPAGEFPSNRLPWLALAEKGVEVIEARLDPDDPEASLIAAMAPRTRLLAVSAVAFDTGLKLDLARLGRACRSTDTLFLVDAIQQIGALPFSARDAQADFIMAGSHKWLMCPEGLALFWSRPQARKRLGQTRYGWRMYERPYRFDRADWTAPDSARRFEIGTLNMTGIHALDAAAGLLLETGMQQVGEALLERTDYLCRALDSMEDLQRITSGDRLRRAGIVSFRHRRLAARDLESRLRERGVHVAARGDMVRLSPHFYTPLEQIDRALELIGRI